MCSQIFLLWLPRVLLCGVLLPFPCFAKTLWSDASVTWLDGSNYRIGDNERTIVTFEHASGQSWGDTFLFVDRIQPDNSDDFFYSEFSPRVRLLDLTRADTESVVQGVYLATTWEAGEGVNNYLYGPGFSLALPKFQFFQVNLYRRDNDSKNNGWQLTAAWGLPFSLASTHWHYGGFIDWAGGSADSHANTNFTSQLKLDVSEVLSLSNVLYVGVEYVYWRNKFGIKNSSVNKTHEANVNVLLKLHF